MEKHLIPVEEFCRHYEIEYNFLYSLNESGLIQFTRIETKPTIEEEDIPRIEKMLRLHQELGINIEGLEAIIPLLDKIEHMQAELNLLRNRLPYFNWEEDNLSSD